MLLHQLVHEMKTVQTELNEDQDSETASLSDFASMALAGSATTSSAVCLQSMVWWAAFQIPLNEGPGVCFKISKFDWKGQSRLEPWQHGCDLILHFLCHDLSKQSISLIQTL